MVRKTLLPLALLIVCFFARSTYADSVTLTTGTASTNVGIGSVFIGGNNFALNYTGEIPQGATTAFAFNSVIFGVGVPTVTFSSVSSHFFNGSLSFNNSVLFGSVTSYASMEDLFLGRSPLFTVTFTGTGYLSVIGHPTGIETRFTVATPEPTSLVLLSTALLTGGAFVRRRWRRIPVT